MTDWRFQRDLISTFRFLRAGIDAQSGEVSLAYAFDQGPELVETLLIPGAPFAVARVQHPAVQRALRLLHLIAGVSYYKAAAPVHIEIVGEPLDAATAAFLREVYLKGLGEFAYRNGLDLSERLRFPAYDVTQRGSAAGLTEAGPSQAAMPKRALVAIGGGKDSLVSIESLRRVGVEQTLCWVGSAPLIRACAEHTGLATLQIERKLAPELFEFNRAGAWNGHIPVTAINSAILLLAAAITGHDAVVFSNERSASYGSVIAGTGEVNHQWSKGWAFESAFRAELDRANIGVDYFSLLRPWSELAVARQFAAEDRYDAHFSSCNRNFHILGSRPASRWCCACPKCRFVFLALAPFMPKPRLVGIFGRNLLDEPEQAAGFDALIEYRDHKPFECVGEGVESRAALAALAAQPAWREDALVARFANEIAPQLDAETLDLAGLLQAQPPHAIPAELWQRLHAPDRT